MVEKAERVFKAKQDSELSQLQEEKSAQVLLEASVDEKEQKLFTLALQEIE